MELKLKDGWSLYFASGFLIGLIFTIVSFLEYFKSQVTPLSIDNILALFVVFLLAVSLFILGSMVIKRPVKS